MESFSNPPLEIQERPIYMKDSILYNVMISKIHQAAHSLNPRSYDLTHHSLETRSSKNEHKNCTIMTPKNYAGKTERDTEEVFWKLVEGKYTVDNGLRAVYFRDLEPFSTKLTNTLNSKKEKDAKKLENVPNMQYSNTNNLSKPTLPIPSLQTFMGYPSFEGAMNPGMIFGPFNYPNQSIVNQNFASPQKISSQDHFLSQNPSPVQSK